MGSLLRYSLNLPVSAAVVGMPRKEMLKHNLQIAGNFTALAEPDMARLRKGTAAFARGPGEEAFRPL